MKIKLNAAPELAQAAEELAHITGVSPSDDGVPVRAVRSDKRGLRLEKTGSGIEIHYGGISDFCRALGLITSFSESGDTALEQSPVFESLGYMPDCSRNAVPSLDGAKELMRHLAVMGFNAVMFYTEDTYEIPEYPYFGHMRGRYSVAEMKEIDRFGTSLGIEVIPCIQVLAHLDQTFRWNCFKEINDIDNILNIADERSYELIDKMLKVCRECFSSNRINLGMDEAHNLGRGKYFDRTGEHTPVTELMKRHLERLIPMAHSYGFTPMMWSDMFFRAQYGRYYITEEKLSPESVAAKPDGVVPIYWDYYCGEETVDNMMTCHEQFGGEYAFAGGAWKWIGFAPNNAYSLKLSDAHLRMCRKHKVRTVFTTGWGDRGGDAAQLSILPALLQYAEYCYADDITNEKLSERCKALFGLSLDDFLTLDLPNTASYHKPDEPCITTQCKYILFNDPLNGLMDKHIAPDDPQTYASHAQKLLALADAPRYGYLFRTLGLLCRALEIKATLTIDIRAAYKAGDRSSLRKIANERIPLVSERIREFLCAFREQWYLENKTIGFDAQEQHIGGLLERLNSTALRLNDLADGKISSIEELEQPVLDFYCCSDDRGKWVHLDAFEWSTIVSATPMK